MPSISSMIADLIGYMRDLDDAIRMIHTEVYFSRTRLYDQDAINAGHARSRENVRLPCIHKKDPDAFHSANALLSKNHPEVPVWCAFQTKSWFFEGSGGESQY
jgi:hypothetical protein